MGINGTTHYSLLSLLEEWRSFQDDEEVRYVLGDTHYKASSPDGEPHVNANRVLSN
jgi:hypothetical protein